MPADARAAWTSTATASCGSPPRPSCAAARARIVARLKLEQLRESVPQAGVVAGALDVTNNGNKLMVDGTGSSIVVRCSPLTTRPRA